MAAERFRQIILKWVLSLPQDVKTVMRIVENPNLDDSSRVAAAGALLHLLSGTNAIPGQRGILALVDDALVVRIITQRVWEKHADDLSDELDDSPQLFDEQARDDIAFLRQHLGELWSVLEKAADGVSKLNHQGHNATQCAADTDGSTWLYDAIHEALVDQLDLDEEEVTREIKEGLDRIIPALKQRVQGA